MNDIHSGFLSRIGNALGVIFDDIQLHISGERTLHSKDKQVLTGKDAHTGKRVVVKTSSIPTGIAAIERERTVRDKIAAFHFADDVVSMPLLLRYHTDNGEVSLVSEFIEQDKVFVDHSLREQFFMALRALEAQENFHATTFEHMREVKSTFPLFTNKEYQNSFSQFKKIVAENYKNSDTDSLLEFAYKEFTDNLQLIDRYGGFLTHEDFVPHNFRIKNRELYLLDFVALRFGNKYDGWARFINYMVIHNPELSQLLLRHVEERGAEEFGVLRLMRLYKIAQLLSFYAGALKDTTGNLEKLTLARLSFWTEVLRSVLSKTELPPEKREAYLTVRDSLRSEEEKQRQKEFAKA